MGSQLEGICGIFSCAWCNPTFSPVNKEWPSGSIFEWAVIGGSLAGAWCSLRDITFQTSQYWLVLLGLFCGTFIGMLAAALTEVLNVLPILAKRVGVDGKIVILLVALVLGKVMGSLFHWIYFAR